MPLETTLFNKDSLSGFLAVPLSYFGMLGTTFPLHCHCLAFFFSLVLDLLSVLLKILNQKYSLPPGSSQNQCIVQGQTPPPPLVMPQVFSRSIMVCVSFQVQNLVSGRTKKLRGIFRGHIRRGPALALGWGSLCSTGLCLSQWKSLPCRAPALAAWRFLPKLPTWQRRVRNRMNKIEFEREGGNAGRRK